MDKKGEMAQKIPTAQKEKSGEINSKVSDAQAVISAFASRYSTMSGIECDQLDGLTVSSDHWWFNLRASNTEPLLRLNVEADSHALMEQIRDEVLATVRG